MERESRMPRWLRRGARGAAAADAAVARRRDELLLAAAAGFPLARAAHPQDYGCSCERIGCPTPGRHPVSFAWQTEATTDPERIGRWFDADPATNVITPTGRVHDVLDVPLAAGEAALARLEAEGVELGPVAVVDPDRMLFFTKTRAPDDEEEWWPCELDCHPETLDEHPGLRWHCRASYVLLPPSRVPGGGGVRWLRGPEHSLPEPLKLLEALTDAGAVLLAEEEADGVARDEPVGWYGR
ncbi:bifunctional DNA primase/polymerase [Streptomyces bohaiensis]|uniref:Bifunctional DNA primase/polymerase n=1 Tax=Streptomyces bohaiensis TaxID=1431344 RepID=A0ABX1CAG1_9ACTN|nr:bifunctional DNA primase/polymerase [Streptomyces bohaiensis]NJQ16118.1 bifunctional DNA primase/polymerase [Streptomyces bohaiensis]